MFTFNAQHSKVSRCVRWTDCTFRLLALPLCRLRQKRASERRQERYLNWKGIEMKIPNNQRSDTPRPWPIFFRLLALLCALLFCQIWSPSLGPPSGLKCSAQRIKKKRGARTITRLTFYTFLVWVNFYYFTLRVARNDIIKNRNLFATLLSVALNGSPSTRYQIGSLLDRMWSIHHTTCRLGDYLTGSIPLSL